MQGWTFAERTQWSPPLWARIILGSFFALTGSLMVAKAPQNFMWIEQLCLGCWFLFALPVPPRGADSARQYFLRPRFVTSFLLLGGVIVGGMQSLYLAALR